MNKTLSSALKLIVSLGVGVFLIWYYYNQISQPETYALSEKISGTSELQVIDILIKDSAYVQVYDTIAVFNSADAGNSFLVSEKEGYFSHEMEIGDRLTAGSPMFTVRIDLMRIMRDVFRRTNYWWLGVSILLSLMSHFSRAVRWKMLLKPLGYNPKQSNTFFAVMIMYLANLAFPRAGEVMRCVMMTRYEDIPVQKSLGTMITERAIDLLLLVITLAILFIAAGPLFMDVIDSLLANIAGSGDSGGGTNWFTYALIGLVVAIAAYFLNKFGWNNFKAKLMQLLTELGDGVKSVKNVEKPFWFVFHSIAVWVLYFFVVIACFQSLPETSSFGFTPGLMVLVFGSIGIILVQGGLGLYPLIVSMVLSIFGLSKATGYAFGWVIWSCQTVLILGGGLLALVAINVLNSSKKTGEAKSDVASVTDSQ